MAALLPLLAITCNNSLAHSAVYNTYRINELGLYNSLHRNTTDRPPQPSKHEACLQTFTEAERLQWSLKRDYFKLKNLKIIPQNVAVRIHPLKSNCEVNFYMVWLWWNRFWKRPMASFSAEHDHHKSPTAKHTSTHYHKTTSSISARSLATIIRGESSSSGQERVVSSSQCFTKPPCMCIAHTNPSINPSTDHWEKRRDDKRKEKGIK